MFFVWIGVIMLVVIGGSVLAGLAINGRSRKARKLSRAEQLQMAKAAGVFPHRKES